MYKIATMILLKHCVYFQIIEVILKDTLQRSDIDIINLLLFFDIIENNMAKSLRIFSSFMTLGPSLWHDKASIGLSFLKILVNI